MKSAGFSLRGHREDEAHLEPPHDTLTETVVLERLLDDCTQLFVCRSTVLTYATQSPRKKETIRQKTTERR